MVYLLHFSEPYKHAQHYLGFTQDRLEQRLEYHQKGKGSKLLKVVIEFGISFQVVRIWENGDRNFERRLKNNGHLSHYCPICKEKRKLKRKTYRK